MQGSSGEIDIENRLMDMAGGEEEESEMYPENNMEIYNTTCKIDGQWEFVIWLRELKQGLYDNLEGWMEREMGGRFRMDRTWVYLWLFLVDV